MAKIKIALLIHSLQAGGMERVMSELATDFAQRDYLEVHLVLFGINREIFYPIPKNISIHKPAFIFNGHRRFISTFKTVLFLRSTLKELQPDTVLSFGEFWNNLVLLSTLGLPVPVFVSDRSQPDKSLGKLQDRLRKWLYPKATGVILQTQKARDIYKAQFKNLNIEVIGNPIRNIENKNHIKRENQILMVGRLISSKHQDRLIRIFANINDPDWKLVLVGYDHLKQKNSIVLKQLIKELQLEDKVILAGKRADVEKYYLQSKIFAFTSSSEGFPNVIGEAMSTGLPVVAYDCVAGPSEMIIDSENGYLIPLFDDELFSEKLQLLMNNESLRNKMGERAKASIQRFSKDKISPKFLDFICSGH